MSGSHRLDREPDAFSSRRPFMYSRARVAVIAMAVMLAAGGSAVAHHSFAAEYDRTKPITLKGTVTKVEWQNPHISFYLDVKDAQGKVENWAIEGGAPNS